jgi:hypothetical protein
MYEAGPRYQLSHRTEQTETSRLAKKRIQSANDFNFHTAASRRVAFHGHRLDKIADGRSGFDVAGSAACLQCFMQAGKLCLVTLQSRRMKRDPRSVSPAASQVCP